MWGYFCSISEKTIMFTVLYLITLWYSLRPKMINSPPKYGHNHDGWDLLGL